jgi:hypothetical protein
VSHNESAFFETMEIFEAAYRRADARLKAQAAGRPCPVILGEKGMLFLDEHKEPRE